MAATFAWGHWEEVWPEGQFHCVFVEAKAESNGMIHATGLYRATPGESFDDPDTYQDRIADRTAVTVDDKGGLVIRKEFAELLATLPIFLRKASRRLNLLGSLCAS